MNHNLENVIATTCTETLSVWRTYFRHAAPRYARSLPARLTILYHLIGPMFRVLSNRWCVFQNSPDWVVHVLALTARRKCSAELTEASQQLVTEAVDEWQLRKRTRQRVRRKQ